MFLLCSCLVVHKKVTLCPSINFTNDAMFAMVWSMGTRRQKDREPERRISILKLLRDNPDHTPAPTLKNLAGLETTRSRCREWAQRFDDASRISGAFQF